MKKTLIALSLCILLGGQAFAQNNAQAMKFLTVCALLQYGEKLYDRGDFNEASAVFDHVLTYDAHQPQALEFLKMMGHTPFSNNIAANAPTPEEQLIRAVDFSSANSLRVAIAAQEKVVDKLRSQIKQMKANMASESAREK